MTTQEKIEDYEKRSEVIYAAGGEKAVAKQHGKGKQTARERLLKLFDEGTFQEVDRFVEHRCTNFGMQAKKIAADGVVCGYGKVDGRLVYAYSQDFTCAGGALGEMHALKICKVMDMALKAGAPCIGLNDSGGARIQEGVDALSGYGQIFRRNSLASGHIPQISVIMGPCAGGAVYSPALTDIIIMVKKTSQMFITGPGVIKATTGEEIDGETLGGADTQTTVSGVAHLAAESEDEALEYVKALLSYLPSRAGDEVPNYEYEAADEARPVLDTVIPDSSKRAYDVHSVIEQIADEGSFLELQPGYAGNVVVGFARFAGRSAGIIANQPFVKAGCLDINASDKAARFIQMCDAFGLPLVTLVDVPGFLPGKEQEYGGIIRHGAKMLYVYSVAVSPKITVILRKAYGGSYLAMCSRDLGADTVVAWPTAEIAVMGADGAANIVFRKEIKDAADPAKMKEEKVEEYTSQFATPYQAAARGYVDAVIKPSETRRYIIEAMENFAGKKREERVRGNMPL
jgi:acetyl-CoA carboxylase carboxyltransferase component